MNKLISAFVFTYLIFIVPSILAAPLEIETDPANATVQPNSQFVYKLIIKNNQGGDDFLIFISGAHLEWKMPGDILITVGPGETKESNMTFYIPYFFGNYSYDVVVSSWGNPAINATTTFYLNIPLSGVVISSFSASQEDMKLNTNLKLISNKKLDADVVLVLYDNNGNVIKTFTIATQVDKLKEFSKVISLEGLSPGSYSLEASVGDSNNLLSFDIEPFHNITQIVEQISNPLFADIIITVKNNGNVVEHDYVVNQTIPTNQITGFVTKPLTCSEVEGKQTCTFMISKLEPGETEKIMYRLEFWPSYARLFAAIIMIGIVGVFYYMGFEKPKIRKRHIIKGSHEHHVVLEIRGSKLHDLKNVVIRDWVSPLAKVLENEFEHLKPIIRKSEAGTELIWRLGNIVPKEERILSYKIKTLFEGTLKMPKAYLRFRNKQGNNVRVYSRPLIIG